MPGYKYDLPTASPLDDYPQWVGLIWAAIHSHLDHPYAWNDADADTAQQYIDDLYAAILLPPPSSGGGIMRLLDVRDFSSAFSVDKIPDLDTYGVRELRLIFKLWNESAGVSRLGLTFNTDSTFSYSHQVSEFDSVETMTQMTDGSIRVLESVPSLTESPNQRSQIELRIFDPESTTHYKNYWIKMSYNNKVRIYSGVWKNTSSLWQIHWSSGSNYTSAGSQVLIYGVF